MIRTQDFLDLDIRVDATSFDPIANTGNWYKDLNLINNFIWTTEMLELLLWTGILEILAKTKYYGNGPS